jgi:hypothetical protein
LLDFLMPFQCFLAFCFCFLLKHPSAFSAAPSGARFGGPVLCHAPLTFYHREQHAHYGGLALCLSHLTSSRRQPAFIWRRPAPPNSYNPTSRVRGLGPRFTQICFYSLSQSRGPSTLNALVREKHSFEALRLFCFFPCGFSHFSRVPFPV